MYRWVCDTRHCPRASRLLVRQRINRVFLRGLDRRIECSQKRADQRNNRSLHQPCVGNQYRQRLEFRLQARACAEAEVIPRMTPPIAISSVSRNTAFTM